ncbi:MAG: UDP-N-acetylmuramoyl-tripeptide--D-alanyl-D-alanine ligase [Crocinitomicaceae bacterium]|nr:UDP-N-acetylmuramoyl-tripeptide--D-alanyl-D-alanine ligase [Crocinitomicaceae bacterium]
MNEAHFSPFYSSTGICTDTRAIQKNCLFICIKGENFDGNTFASKALKQGAKHVIIDNASYFDGSDRMTLVEDSVKYLQALANHHRNKFSIPVIGITGSNGKTTTKELINAVLSKKYNVLATIGNLNNHLGVPFTLLRMTDEHDIAIIEMGANRFKDIEELCEIAEPTHGIITNIGKAHLEGFLNFDGVLKTKKELYDSIEKNNGSIVINEDDQVLMGIAPADTPLVTYGAEHSVSIVRGELVRLSPYVIMKWATDQYESKEITTRMVGEYNFYNYLAAITFGVEFNIESSEISEAIEQYTPTNNRSQVKDTENNTLILDCYNANPSSTNSALRSFAMNDHSNKLFILGDMRELGGESGLEHQKIIDLVESLGLEGYVVGDEYGKLESPALLKKFADASALVNDLRENPLKDQLILLKGSRGIGLEVAEAVL